MAGTGAAPSKLIGAIRSTQLEAVKAALAEGADIEEADIHGCTGLPLRTACFVGKLDIVSELLKKGADLNASGGDGPGAPLRLALRCNNRDLVALLLANGAQVPPGVEIPAGLLAQAAPASQKVEQPPLEFDFPAKTPVPATSAAPQPASAPVHAARALDIPPEAPAQIAAAVPDILLDSFEPDVLGISEQAPEPPRAPAGPVFPEGHVIEEVDVSACYGTDTNLLGLDLLKQAEEAERSKEPPPAAPPEPKGFWTTTRNKS